MIWRFIDKPRKFYPALIGLFVALSFATKETTFITVFVMGTFFLFALCIPPWRKQVWGAVRAAGLDGWGWCLAAFAGSFTILFTTFLTHPTGLWDGIYTGLEYWLGQHDVGRGGEPERSSTPCCCTWSSGRRCCSARSARSRCGAGTPCSRAS